jgi:hypothetical protein
MIRQLSYDIVIPSISEQIKAERSRREKQIIVKWSRVAGEEQTRGKETEKIRVEQSRQGR